MTNWDSIEHTVCEVCGRVTGKGVALRNGGICDECEGGPTGTVTGNCSGNSARRTQLLEEGSKDMEILEGYI